MDKKLTRNKEVRRQVRKFRIRKKIEGNSERPRLVFVKSLNYLYAQIINDATSHTLKAFSTLNNELFDKQKNKKNIESCKLFGEFVGEKLQELGVKKIVFDRNGYLYHGKVKVFSDAVRSKGIDF